MAIGFIIMQIGNPDLDRVCADTIAPALTACGLLLASDLSASV